MKDNVESVNDTKSLVHVSVKTELMLWKDTYLKNWDTNSTIIHNSQDAKSTKMSTGKSMDTENVAYIQDTELVSLQKGWNSAICSNKVGTMGH